MRSFVVFSCLNQLFGIDIECIKRILGAENLTEIPDEEDHIEGMFQYEDEVLKVVSFRKLIGQISYEEQLRELFPELEAQHRAWLDTLIKSVEQKRPFTLATDPHSCNLGKWIDSFHPDNVEVIEMMKELNLHHQRLHHSAIEILEIAKTSMEDAKIWIDENVQKIYDNTFSNLKKISDRSKNVATDMQQCLVLVDKDNVVFGMNIDKVEEIIHVDESTLHTTQEVQKVGEFMHIEAILEFKGKLVTIINNMKVI